MSSIADHNKITSKMRMYSSSATSSGCKSKVQVNNNKKAESKARLSEYERDQIRRRRNIISSKRSRERKAQKLCQDQKAVFEIEKRIDRLEKVANDLISELSSKPTVTLKANREQSPRTNRKKSDPLSWFGEPF